MISGKRGMILTYSHSSYFISEMNTLRFFFNLGVEVSLSDSLQEAMLLHCFVNSVTLGKGSKIWNIYCIIFIVATKHFVQLIGCLMIAALSHNACNNYLDRHQYLSLMAIVTWYFWLYHDTLSMYRRRVVSLSKTLYSPKVLVNYPGSGGSVRHDWKIVDWDVKPQHKHKLFPCKKCSVW